MNKRFFALLLVLVYLMSGCSLASTESGSQTPEMEDQLVGMLITMDHFLESTEEAYIEMPLWNAQSGMEEPIHYITNEGKRLYTELTEQEYEADGEIYTTKTYEFPEGTGIPYMAFLVQKEGENENYWSYASGPEVSGGERKINVTDDGTNIEISGTIYVDENAVDLSLYLNPVYQNAEGEVYALGASPVGFHAVSMSGCTQTISQQTSASIGEIRTSGGTVTLLIEAVKLPDSYVVLEMDKDHQLVNKMEYAPEEMPETYVPAASTAYIVVEGRSGEAVTRNVYSPGDESARIESFFPAEFGICIKGYTEIQWEVE